MSKNSIQNVELTKNNQCRINLESKIKAIESKLSVFTDHSEYLKVQSSFRKTWTIKRHILLPMNVYEYKTTKLKAHLLQLCKPISFHLQHEVIEKERKN